MTIIVVLLILIVLLRAIVAPLYLIGSVIISYLAALGLGVVVFQFILGQELHWSVPGLAFIILVAMGADYNMFLISRIRDESPRGIRSGVIRTVGYTGGVITAAGLIFAASMFGLLFASIGTIVQAGFVVGTGILLDTFLVRTVTVPAMAVLVGRANWWPSRWRLRRPPQQSAQNSYRRPMPDGAEEDATIPGGQRPVDPVNGDHGKVDFTGVQWGSVEWTLLCMLYLRVCESRLAHPILGDHFAAQDVVRIDYDLKPGDLSGCASGRERRLISSSMRVGTIFVAVWLS